MGDPEEEDEDGPSACGILDVPDEDGPSFCGIRPLVAGEVVLAADGGYLAVGGGPLNCMI